MVDKIDLGIIMLSKNKNKSLIAIASSIVTISSLSACNRVSQVPLAVENAEGSNVYSQSVDNQYIIKRKGLAYLEGDSAFENKYNLKIVKKLSSVLIEIVTSDDSGLVDKLKNDPAIEYIEPDYIRKMNTQNGTTASGVSSQSTIQMSGITQANSLFKGQPFITVAVVSTGVDTSHPDLKGKLVTGHSAFGEDDSYQDINGVGTQQAGVIVASNPNQRVFGIAPGCKVMPIKAMNEDGEVRDSNLLDGIVWAIDHGANVVTFTAEGKEGSKAFDDVFKYAYNKKVPVVVGSGDTGDTTSTYPASAKGVISVSALSSSSRTASFSSRGEWVSVSAPGENIMSTSSTKTLKTTPNYAPVSGTAIAASYVAGQMALIKSKYPTLDMVALRNHLELTSDDLGTKGPDNETGFGRINAARALTVQPPKKK
jgi:hypothetical protein